MYYSTVFGVFQYLRGKFRLREAQHHAEGVNIINSEGIAYHQHEVLYIIKPQGRCTLTRDEIQGRLAALDDIHDCVVMICQA